MISYILNRLKLKKLNREWRKNNSANFTSLVKNCPINKIHVGKGTYGPLHIESWSAENEKLIIGSYCSISQGVKFVLGGNHEYKSISTYPFKVKMNKLQAEEATSKGAIIIEDDVWIGLDALILSGVRIGQGAIVGARAVVSKDIPPYSIVIGNPAYILKKRFPDEIIDKLLEIDMQSVNWADIPIEKLYKPINDISDLEDIFIKA